MCGRYTGYIDESEELKTIYTIAKSAWPDADFRSGEIFPSNTVPILVSTDESVRAVPGFWGFPGRSSLINARSETAAQKPAFADAFRWCRCAVPSTGYFEWDREKKKYLFRQPDRDILFLAGLYRVTEDRICFVILTTAANESVSPVHHRMPVILDRTELYRWNRDRDFASACLARTMPELIRKEA